MSTIATYIKRHRVVLIIDLILIIMYIIVTSVAHNKVSTLYSQQEASRWENDEVTNVTGKDKNSKAPNKKKVNLKSLVGEKRMPYAQVSAFISPGHGMQLDEVSNVRSSIAEKLNKDSYSDSMTGGRVWIDAYSCETNINLRKDTNTLSATAVGVGGDFFQFHPMKLLSGSYIADSDLNHDRIVVDENFAWAMFGSNDIVGMQVWLGDSIYFISGVVEVPEDDISALAYGDNNRVYMYYSELKRINENLPITCYEAVLPNPISNYAYYALREAYGLSDDSEDTSFNKKKNPLSFDDVEIIENTKRFNTMELLTNIKTWKFRTMRTSSVGYPYWENVARVQDDTQMRLLLVRIILLIFPILSGIWFVYGLWKKKTWTIKGLLFEEIDKAKERKAWKLYEEKMAAEDAAENPELAMEDVGLAAENEVENTDIAAENMEIATKNAEDEIAGRTLS